MFNEEIFNFDIDNIKNDLAIEGMQITDQDVNLFRKFANDEINMAQVIEEIKNQIIWTKEVYKVMWYGRKHISRKEVNVLLWK